ncbi:MAG: OadG family protein [Firmicutes bacterium]|nr:OadG family protein [Bacillota bacterium]
MELALTVTFVGLFVVFTALIILAFMIFFTSKVFALKISNNRIVANNSKAQDILHPTNIKKDTVAAEKDNAVVVEKDESELIAVLTAAVMASMKQAPDFKVKIKSFKRICNDSPAWSSAGLAEQISSRI